LAANHQRFLRAVVPLMLGLSAAPAAAQNYPAKSIRMVVPFASGGPTDILARSVGARLSEVWGQQMVIDNRAGAAGNIGAEMVAKAAPDGYTLLTASSGILTVNPTLFRKLPYDVLRDFAPVTMATSVTNIMVVHPALPAKSVRELLDIARQRPGQLSYAASGMGSASHLSMELLKSMAAIDVAHIPYKGAHPGVVDLVAGQVQVMLIGLPVALPHVRTGRLRALAVATAARSALLPGVPTVAEAGVAGFEVPNWDGWLAPRGTPPAVIARLNAAMRQVLAEPEIVAEYNKRGMEPLPSDPATLGAEIRQRIAQFAPVVRATGATPE